jgi:signal recognition particle subunit SRP19
MSRRTITVEEDFDDDADLSLPSRALPNTGARGAILEEIGFESDRDVDEDNGDEDDDPDFMELGGPQPSASRQEASNSYADRSTVTDIRPYKS